MATFTITTPQGFTIRTKSVLAVKALLNGTAAPSSSAKEPSRFQRAHQTPEFREKMRQVATRTWARRKANGRTQHFIRTSHGVRYRFRREQDKYAAFLESLTPKERGLLRFLDRGRPTRAAEIAAHFRMPVGKACQLLGSLTARKVERVRLNRADLFETVAVNGGEGRHYTYRLTPKARKLFQTATV